MAENITNAPSLTATASDFPMLPVGVDPDKLAPMLEKAADIRAAARELDELEQWQTGIVATMFPEKDERGRTREEQARDLRKYIASVLQSFLEDPFRGAHNIAQLFTQTLQASLVGPPIDWKPAYQPIYPMVLQRAQAKDWRAARTGDPIEVAPPITVDTAVNFNPNGNPQIVKITGSRSTVYPYWKRTNAYTIDFFEWSDRLIQVLAIKKRQLRQELDKSWDDDVISAFDAAVPDGSLYSSHPTHTVTNTSGTLTAANFKSAARKLIHTDSTGTDHEAPPGVALTDPLACFQIRDWGTDEWSEETVDDYARHGFPLKYDGSVVTGMQVEGFSIVRNPRGGSNMKVRFFPPPQYVGYFVPVTLLGKRTIVRAVPMTGGDPDWEEIRNANTPPGFDFQIEAYEAGAITIPGYLHLGYLNQS